MGVAGSHADVLQEECEECSRHDDGGCGALVFELSETLVGEHELSMRQQLCVECFSFIS